jgi:hypothetical protein
VRSALLRVTTAVTFSAEAWGSPVAAARRNTLPGIAAKSVLDVMTTATTVANRLLLYVSAEITNIGRRTAWRDPSDAPQIRPVDAPPRLDHQSPETSPRTPLPHGDGIRRGVVLLCQCGNG